MKIKVSGFSRRFSIVLRLLLVCAWLAGISAQAQNLLKNWDFEQPLGPTNWTVMYFHGTKEDWEITDRARGGSMYSQVTGNASRLMGGYLRPLSSKLEHACFTQTITNLTLNHVYTLAGYMQQDWWKAPNDALRDKHLIYAEVIGGQGTPTGDGRFSMIATNDFTDVNENYEPNIDPPYTYPTVIWRPFYAKQIPASNRTIEVRLHYNKVGWTTYDKMWISAGSFDDFSLTP